MKLLPDFDADWPESRLGSLFAVRSGDQISSSEMVDEGVPLVGGNGTRGHVPVANINKPSLIVGRVGALCGNAHSYAEPIWASEHALVLAPRSSSDLRFFRYVLSTADLRELAVGAAQPVISATRLGQVSLPVPPLEVQRAIADFLDRETKKIDTLIAKKERLLELLDEKRTALITQAVTKGLDPDVPMTDSGIEWLGEIPEHWEVATIKNVARLRSGHTPSRGNPEYWQSEDLPWVTLSDVGRLRSGRTDYVDDTKEWISDLGLRNSAAELLPEGTVMLSRTASVGYSAIMARPMATSQDFANWICGESLVPEYLMFVFRGMRREFNRLMMGSTHQTIYMPAIRGLKTPLPPLGEQERIAEMLQSNLAGFFRTSDETVRSLDLLREYRAALISAAVTG
ncbi:MAG: restriction endonuclease subunit S, partial [Longimicrobiales bacterium]